MKDTLGVEVEHYSRSIGSSTTLDRPFVSVRPPATKIATAPIDTRVCNILSIDVEDYYHPTEAQNYLTTDQWKQQPSRVEKSMRMLLEAMADARVKSTCFILGWLAERHPRLVAEIAAAGHEIACHSYAHQLVFDLTPRQFREDTLRAVAVIEDACGITPRIYRAPSCSITRRSEWALEILAECGFTHDSSIYPVAHDRYGMPGSQRGAHFINTPSGPIMEVPVATADLGGGVVTPVGGGAYLRLFPYRYTAAGIRQMNSSENMPACLYVHPWEFDTQQPRLIKGLLGGIRTYYGLNSMESKFNRLIRDFRFAPLGEVVPV